ncbi:MAG: GGDEF domain-containing protein [Pirellulales bacterium]|nr:GGDEF domain-containing protein [Pirellulales bacterium]
MVVYILLIAVVNLGVGFALAVYLAKQQPPAEIAAPLSPALARAMPSCVTGELFTVVPEPDTELSDAAQPIEKRDVPPESPTIAPDEEEPAGAAGQDELQMDVPREPSPSESSVIELQNQVHGYDGLLVDIAEDLRNPASPASPEWLRGRLRALHDANDEYLRGRDRAMDAFEPLHKDRPELAAICDSVQEAIQRQANRVQDANESIDCIHVEASFEESRGRAACEANRLLDANHHLRDVLDEAMVGIARREHWLLEAGDSRREDPLTGLGNRAGLEIGLIEWWNQDPQRVRPLAVAMLDIDHFARLNERHGRHFGDQMIRAVAQLASTETRGSSLVARYRGQRFVILFPDGDARAATSIVEKLRQTMELTRLEVAGRDARVTLSCGVADATPTDTTESLLGRLDATVDEAKRYGRNRTFVHDGKYPTPVVPPNFSLQERTVVL